MTGTSESESCGGGDFGLPKVVCDISNCSGKVEKSPEKKLKKSHACDFVGCNATFSRPWRLAAHTAKHFGEKPFPCDYIGCGKAYTSNYHLRRHKLTSHSGDTLEQNVYRCHYPGCKKEFKFSQNVKKHFRRTHEEKSCKECGKHFFKHSQLKKHYKLHTSKYPFECQQCDLKFEHKFLFRRHQRSHVLHVCPKKDCANTFVNWSNLRKHLATHPHDYICAYCGKGYRTRTFLKAHIIRHIDGGIVRKRVKLIKFSCDICYLELSGKASLKRHIKNKHETIKVKEPVSKPKIRATRKDKGVPKRSLAVILSEVVVPKEVEQMLVSTSTQEIELFSNIPPTQLT